MKSTIAFLVLGISLAAPAPAQQLPAPLDSLLRRIFASREFAAQRFGPARWIDNGNAYTTVERSDSVAGGREIVRYETASGARRVLVSARQLVPPGDTAALGIDDYAWSPDGRKLLLFTNSERVWRQNTRGDYWVLDRESGTLKQLGAGGPPSTLMYAKFAPGGDRVAYVRHGDLFVERLADGAVIRLTSGADSLHVNGMTDWVYEEEFGLRDGFRWSPDGRRLAFWHFDMTGVGTFLLINNTDSIYPVTIPIQYPKSGTVNSAVTAGVINADGGPVTWLQLPGDAREDYLPRMEWADSATLILQRINRRQDSNRVMLADARTGSARTILTERDSAWLDVVEEFAWINRGREFLWPSERDGWRHVYRVALDGTTRLITPGAFDVIDVAAVDEAGGWLYYIASPGNATQRYLYRTRLTGSGRPERVTPEAMPGSHSYDVSPDARWTFHNFSSFDRPPAMDLVELPRHRSRRVLVANDTLRQRAAEIISPGRFFQVTLPDSVTLDGWMIRPRDFDSTRTYPILMYVYGEPAGQTVRDTWNGASRLWYQVLADQGYLVASVDNRGTPSPRGRAWRKVVYGAIGELSSREQADAVRGLTRTHRWIDSTRVGIWGWSGGGTNTLNALFRYPGVYRMGMAVAPVPDQRLYDTIYQERYMNTPDNNPEGYRRGSAINFAAGLEGDLLLVHGSGDDNVHYQGSERLLNALIGHNKLVDFMEYPNRSHCICEQQGTTLNVYSLLTRYLLTRLPAGGLEPGT